MYDAFISYSRKDGEFARRLQKALEDYRPPRGLAAPQRHLEVFRDEADFTGVDYSKSVERYLADSAKLLVVCSPQARASAYVNDEVRRFAQARGAEKIIPILLSGIPNNEAPAGTDAAFPEALCEALSMPLATSYIGFDPRRDRVERGAFAGSWYSLLANLYDLSRAEVEQREQHRRARARRITASFAGGIIVALSAALVVSLMFWRQAVADRKVAVHEKNRAEASAQAERLALANERTARLAEEKERLVAEERRREAERQRAAALREAVAARRETAGRLAVQAIEKLDGAPEKALRLAMAAVQGFHQHGDPVVPTAVAALQKVALAFAGSRPVLPWGGEARPVALDPRLRWAATSDSTGEVQFAPAGSAAPRPLAPPRGVLAKGEGWSRAETKLAFTAHRLIAARAVERAGPGSDAKGVIWSWPLGDRGIEGDPAVVATFKPSSWEAVELLPSPDGGWLAWRDGYQTVLLRALTGAGETRAVECRSFAGCLWAFSPASRVFYVFHWSDIRRFALARGAGPAAPSVTELAPIGSEIGQPFRIAAFARDGPAGSGPDEPAGPVDRLAVLGVNGDVEWWDTGGPAPVRQALPNVFAAYQDQLEVFGLGSGKIRGDLQWSPEGNALLVSLAEADGEFGIAALHELRGESAWHPLAHRYESKILQSSMSRLQGGPGGVAGYRVKNVANLGVSSAGWVTSEGVFTLGFDGTLFVRELKGFTPGKYVLKDTRATSARFAGRWILVGRRDGRLRLVDPEADDEAPEALVLNGHDAPIREIVASPDLTRLVSTDAKGVARVWSLAHPILKPQEQAAVAAHWRWLRTASEGGGTRLWPLGGRDPLSAPDLDHDFTGAAAVAWDAERPEVAVLHFEPASPLPLVVRLWTLTGDRPALSLRRERRFAAEPRGSSTTWALWLASSDRQARVAIQRRDGLDSAVWTTDLLDHGAVLHRLGDKGLNVALQAAGPGLRWLLISSGPRGELPVAAAWLADLGGWQGLPRAVPLDGLEVRYSPTWSPDGQWVALRSKAGHHILVDLAAAAGSGRVRGRVELAGDEVFGRGRPPLDLDRDGNLRAWQERPEGAPRPFAVLRRTGLAALSWDEAGEWLALGHRDGRVWLAHPERAGGASRLAQELRAAMLRIPLPPPAEAEARAQIERVFPFPEQGWVVGVTDKHMALVWHRSSDGAWEAPVVFTAAELRLEDSLFDVRFRPDGRMALFGGQVVSFDPDQLLAQARLLLSGRVQ